MEKQELFGNNRDLVLYLMGSLCGVALVWRIPFLVYEFGGGAFILAYFIGLFILGLPLFILELLLGQKMEGPLTVIIKKIKYKLQWIGWVSFILCFIFINYLSIVLIYSVDHLYYTSYAALNPLGIQELNVKLSNAAKNFEAFNQLSPFKAVFALLLLWLVIYGTLQLGFKFIKKMNSTLLIILSCLLITLSTKGFLYILKDTAGLNHLLEIVRFSGMFDVSLWLQAFSQAGLTLGVGLGLVPTLATHRPRTAEVIRLSRRIALLFLILSIIVSLHIISTLGFMANISGESVLTLFNEKRFSLIFLLFPSFLQQTSQTVLFLIIYFIFLFLSGFLSLVLLSQMAVLFLREHWSFPYRRTNRIFCLFSFILGIFIMSELNIPRLNVFDQYLINFGLLTVILVEIFIFMHRYDPQELMDFIEMGSGSKIGRGFFFLTQWIAPVILFILILLGFTAELGSILEKNLFWRTKILSIVFLFAAFAVAYFMPRIFQKDRTLD